MDIDKLINELEAKRDELCGYVEDQRSNMDYDVIELPRPLRHRSLLDKLLSPLEKFLSRSKSVEQHPEYDYSPLSQRISKRTRELHTHISDSWIDFVSGQQTELKRQISEAQIGDMVKRKMIDLAVRHSVIQCSMLDILSGLSKIDSSVDSHTPRMQAVEAYRRYYEGFLDDYKKLIEDAWYKQNERYEEIDELNKI